MSKIMEEAAGVSEPKAMVAEYVQNLVDVVSEQIKLHTQEMHTLERLNNLTLSKQSNVLSTL